VIELILEIAGSGGDFSTDVLCKLLCTCSKNVNQCDNQC